MNQCVYTGYNVPSAPPANTPPPVVPTPLATPTPSPTGATTPTRTTAQGSSASKSQWRVASAVVALAFSLFFMA